MYGIFTYIWVIYGVNVGIHIPYMEHMGTYSNVRQKPRLHPLLAAGRVRSHRASAKGAESQQAVPARCHGTAVDGWGSGWLWAQTWEQVLVALKVLLRMWGEIFGVPGCRDLLWFARIYLSEMGKCWGSHCVKHRDWGKPVVNSREMHGYKQPSRILKHRNDLPKGSIELGPKGIMACHIT